MQDHLPQTQSHTQDSVPCRKPGSLPVSTGTERTERCTPSKGDPEQAPKEPELAVRRSDHFMSKDQRSDHMDGLELLDVLHSSRINFNLPESSLKSLNYSNLKPSDQKEHQNGSRIEESNLDHNRSLNAS